MIFGLMRQTVSEPTVNLQADRTLAVTRPDPLPVPSRHALQPMILHVRVVAGSGGGPEKTIFRSAAYVRAQGYQVAAAYLHPHKDPGMNVIRKQASAAQCPLYEIGESGPVDPRAVRHLYQLCRKLRVAVWHGHDYKSNALGLLLRRFWNMKLVTTVHGWTWDTARAKLYYHVDNLCLPRYDHVMTVSPKLTDHCRAHGVLAPRLTYLPNGIEIQQFQPRFSRQQARAQLNISPDVQVIGVVGRLSREKGVDRAIDMMKDLLPRYPQAQLHLIGDGPQRAALEAQARQLGVLQGLRFHGWQSDARLYYQAMNLILLPSRTEGMPNVLLEAMAMGVPIAAAQVGGVNELLDEGRCGVLLSDDCSQWAMQIQPLLGERSIGLGLARRARERVENQYSFSQRMAGEVAVYDQLLERTSFARRLAA